MHKINREQELVLEKVCNERFRSVKEDLDELKNAFRDRSDKIDDLFRNFKIEVVKMIQEASEGKPIRVETGMKSRDKALVFVAFITGASSIIVTLVQVIGG